MMDSWFGLDEDMTCRRRSVVRRSRLDLEEFSSRHLERLRSLVKTATDGSTTDIDELRKNFRAMQEENNKLQAVITDVTEVNKQWQKYNNDRQLYVQCLLTTIQDQQEKMNKIVDKRVFPTKTQAPSEEEKRKQENARLKEEVAALERRLEQKDQEHREHVEVLEFQVKAHRDDWEAERSEKQQVIKQKEELELRVQELQRELCSLRLRMKEEQPQKHCANCCDCADSKMCSSDHPKTYRTSVHLPCTSGQVLPKEKTCCSGNRPDPLNKDTKKLRSRSSSVEETQSTCSVMEDAKLLTAELDEDKPFSNMEHRYSCSVLHISPTASGSSLAADESSSSGVTIGFNSSGLASVTSFSERPVVKSSSMPISEMINHDNDMKPTFSQWSLDSGWASVMGPPTTSHITRNISEEKSYTMMKSKSLTKSESNMTAANVRKTSVPWKAKYFEEGVATQTKEDVICPGCGQIFPPSQHLQWLDHFEICQNCVKDTTKKKCGSAFKYRN